MAKESEVPKLDLEQFVFKPPGPMGWGFEISEYDIENAKRGILNIIETEEQLLDLGKIYELGANTISKNEKQENVEVERVEEVIVNIMEDKLIEPENRIRIILPVGPLKLPWLPKKDKKKRNEY